MKSWMNVEAVLDSHLPLCEGCEHQTTWKESYPYGETTVYQVFTECSVQSPGLCPVLESEEEK